MSRSRVAFALAFLVAFLRSVPASGEVRPEPVAEGLDFPTNLAFAPDGRIFFTEKDTGNVRILEGGRVLPEPFATLPVEGGGEIGLLGIALDPSFPNEPWVYLYYSDATDGRNRLVRIRAEGHTGVGREVLLDLLPTVNGYHNGGDLAFGPDDKLYVVTGEAHESSRAQDPRDLGGKVLRLNPDGSIPADNPFGPHSPVFALGIRNSFGLCFDPESGGLWETENGPTSDDEVNLIEAGGNYGWPDQLGPGGAPRFVDPILDFPEVIVPTGCAGTVADGGLYFGDFQGRLHRMVLPGFGADDRTPRDEIVARFDAGITDVAMVPGGHPDAGALYVATADAIYRLGAGAVPSTSPPGGTAPRGGAAWALGALILAAFLALTLAFRLRARR